MFVLMLLFLTSFVAIPPASIATPSLPKVSLEPQEVLDTSLTPGIRFTIDLCVDYVEKLWGYQLELSFNPAVLHGVKVENGPFLESAGGTATVVPGPGFNNTLGKLGLFAAALFPVVKFPTGGGTLATITFEVAGYGGSSISLMEPDTGLANRTGGYIITKDPTYTREYHPECFFDSYFDNRPPIRIDPEKVTDVAAGGSFMINVSVAEMTDLYSWEFCLNWSAPVLNVTSVAEGDLLKSQPDGTQFYHEIHNEEGYIYANCTRTGTTGVTGNGTLAQITFLVEQDMANSTLHLYDTLLLDPTKNALHSMTIDGFFTNEKIHNIAVTSVTASPSMVEWGSGDPVDINVTVEDTGAFSETFNVTIYYDEKEIDRTDADISLDSGENVTLTFTWDTTGVEMGSYTIKAVASVVAEEANIADNTGVYRSVVIAQHNVGLVFGTTSASSVNVGESVVIGVLIQNRGSVTENFDVVIYCNESVIKTEAVSDLVYAEFRAIAVTWNVTDAEPGFYLIKAETSVVAEDVDLTDNVLNIAVVEVMRGAGGFLSLHVVIIIAIVAVVASVSVAVIVFRRMRKRPEEVLGESSVSGVV